MKVAIVGSRELWLEDFSAYLPADTTEIISGGARGIDRCAAAYARREGLKLTEFLPNYAEFGRSAPLRRNVEIIDYADLVLIFWDGQSPGSRFVVDRCKKMGKPHRVFVARK